MSCNPCNDCPPEVSYTLPDCPGGESCDEISKADCVTYKGPNLSLLGINNNARLKDVLIALHQTLMLQQYNATIPYTEWFVKTYILMVNTVQTKTTVEYIDQYGVKQTLTVSPATSTTNFNVTNFCALENSPVVISGNGVLVKGADDSTAENVSSNGTTLTMTTNGGASVGAQVVLYSGTGTLVANTLVTAVDVNGTDITVNTAPTVALANAKVVFVLQNTCYAHD